MKKKQEDPPKGAPAWMATFSDLMNLLLCFFVLLFSMSSVDESKAEAMIKSLADSFSIFSGGGEGLEDAVLVASGASQLSNLDNYSQSTGQTDESDSLENVNVDEKGSTNEDNKTPSSEHPEEGSAGEDKQNQSSDVSQGQQGESGAADKDKMIADAEKFGLTEEQLAALIAKAAELGLSEEEIAELLSNAEKLGLSEEDLVALLEAKELADNKAQSGAMYDEIMGLAEKFKLTDLVDIAVDKNTYEYIQMEVSGAFLFESGKDTVKKEALPILSRLGDILKLYTGYKIEVIGHTDNVPIKYSNFESNDVLSACRAISVAEYFAVDKKMGWDNIYYAGRGEHEPVADNGTAEGRAQNRRVEIRLYNQKNSQ